LRPATLAALERAQAALGPAAAPPAQRIHDFRIGMKRWRALLRLLEPTVGKKARTLRRQASDLARALSSSRDIQAACDALADLAAAPAPDATLPDHLTAALTERLEHIRPANEAALSDSALRKRLLTRLAAAQEQLAAWPIDNIATTELAKRLAHSYRRVRCRLPADWTAADPDAVHELRKAVVVLRYQLELLEPLWPRLWHVITSEVQKLRQHLGQCNDLRVLERLSAPGQPLARWQRKLAPLIARRRQQHLADAALLAARLFAEKPRSFQDHILALVAEPHAPAPS
jgi:CHAD domain-containing protein